MKPSTTLPKQLQVLVLAGISAVVLHGLGLSYLQLQRTKRTPPQDLPSRDNTPELLQFSRQRTQPTNLDLLPLPQARILPPPRRNPAQPQETKRKLQGKLPPKLGVKPAKRPPGVGSHKVVASPAPAVPKDFADAIEALRLFQGSFDPSSQRQDRGRPSIMRSLLPQQEDAFNEIWAQARPQPIESVANLRHHIGSGSLEIRSIALEQAENTDLPISHQLFVVLNNRVALFWIDGQKLWILQSSHSPLAVPESGSDSRS